MLRIGKTKRDRRQGAWREGVSPVAADAFALPLPDGSGEEGADALTCAFGLRNMLPRAAALHEMRRVLKPSGAAWILEFGTVRGKVWGGAYSVYLQRILPRIGGMLAGDRAAYAYLARTIRDFPPAVDLARELRAAGFSRVLSRALCGGIVFLHLAEK
jgi:demethylmenaquinone methyltransferase/2-methoxy-6-polyprenyl-1,4-benzoquinol methylase